MDKKEACQEFGEKLSDVKKTYDVFYKQFSVKTIKERTEDSLDDLFTSVDEAIFFLQGEWDEFLVHAPSGRKFVNDSDLQQTFVANGSKKIEIFGKSYKVGGRFKDKIEDGPGKKGSVEIEIVGFTVKDNEIIVRFINNPREAYATFSSNQFVNGWEKI